jgi:hypothetical protein
LGYDNAGNPNFVVVAGNDTDSSSEVSVKAENERWVCLLTGVVRTNENNSLGNLVVIPDPDAAAQTTFEAVEQQTLTFFASRYVARAGSLTEVDSPNCFWCLR